MWILTITNIKKHDKRFIGALNYDKLILYINNYEGVKKIDDYNFKSVDYDFTLNLVDMLDWRDLKRGKH